MYIYTYHTHTLISSTVTVILLQRNYHKNENTGKNEAPEFTLIFLLCATQRWCYSFNCVHMHVFTDTYNLQHTHCRRGSSSSSHTSGSGLIFIIVITLYYVHILALLLSTSLISTRQDPVRYTIVLRGGCVWPSPYAITTQCNRLSQCYYDCSETLSDISPTTFHVL